MIAIVALAAETPPAERPGIPASEVRALRDLVRGVARAAPLLDTNPRRARAMVRAAMGSYQAACGEGGAHPPPPMAKRHQAPVVRNHSSAG